MSANFERDEIIYAIPIDESNQPATEYSPAGNRSDIPYITITGAPGERDHNIIIPDFSIDVRSALEEQTRLAREALRISNS